MFCHPGTSGTLSVLQLCFWWPSFKKDVRDFVLACPVCAQQKTPRAPQAGFLCPLSVLRCPWSHISMDIVTGLPLSAGHTTLCCRPILQNGLLHCPSCLQPKKLPCLCPSTFFACMAAHVTTSLTEAPSLSLTFVESFDSFWGSSSACRWGSILSLTDKQRE